MPDSGASSFIIAVDPGTHKCGVALLDPDGDVVWKGIEPRDQVLKKISELIVGHPVAAVAIGASTQGASVLDEFNRTSDIPGELVDETDSTMQARVLFWKENKPGCLWSVFPPSFRPLPRPIDDYAAIIIGRRYLENIRGK